MIKVLHFYKTSLPQSIGGIEVFIDSLCRATSAYGVKNIVASLAKKPALEPISMSNYYVLQFKQDLFIASTGISLDAVLKFKKLARNADIVHYHFPYPLADLMHLILAIKKPTIVTYHSDIVKQKILYKLYWPIGLRFLKKAYKIVATSPNYIKSSPVLTRFRNKTLVIPIGRNPREYENLNTILVNYWKNILTTPFFLFVGTPRYYKGLYFAIDAIKKTSINLVIAGSGGIEDELKRYATKQNVRNVKFLGLVNEQDKLALLHICYGFVLPSHLRSEAFGVALLEAAMFEKPLISCEIGTGTSFMNLDGQTGIVVPPSSSKELKEAMLFLLNNPDKAKEMGRCAGWRARTLFNSEKQALSYYDIYTKAIKIAS